jgi:hypothetical protein
MKNVKAMTGKHLANWFRKKGAGELGTMFEEHVAEAYDHLPLDTVTSRVAMLESIEKRWRGKRCSVVTIVLESK